MPAPMLTLTPKEGFSPGVFRAIWIFEQAVGIDGLAFAVWASSPHAAVLAVSALLAAQGLYLVYFFAVFAPALRLAPGRLRVDLPPVWPGLWLATSGPLFLAIFYMLAAGSRRGVV